MEEFRTIIYDRIQDLVVERLTTSNYVAYAAKRDTLRTFEDTVLRSLNSFTSESIVSSSQRQEQLKAKHAFVGANQYVLGAQL